MILGGTSTAKAKGQSAAPRYRFKYARPIETVEDSELYSSPIALYDTIPNTSLSVADFERFALGRLKGKDKQRQLDCKFKGKSCNWYSL